MRTIGFDVAVVGAGAAGCVVASRLAESGDRSVVVLEAGSDLGDTVPDDWRDGWTLPSTLPDWDFFSQPSGSAAPARLRRGRVIGGTSWFSRFAVRGAAADFDEWAARGNPGWSFADVLPTFRRLEADAEFGDDEWHGADGPMPITRYPSHTRTALHEAALEAMAAAGFPRIEDHNNPYVVGVGPLPMNSRDGRRITSADAYLPMGRQPPNLTIRTDAPVARIGVEDGHAEYLELADGTRLATGWIVLSAGTYGSPPILMRSGIGPAEHLRTVGVAPLIDLPGVGANLADHPGVELDSGGRGTPRSQPVLHSIATFRSSAAQTDGAPDLMFWVQDPSGDNPALWLDPILLKPASRGAVHLGSPDPANPPLITLPRVVESDIERLAEGYRIGVELAHHPAIRKLAPQSPPSAPPSNDELRRLIADTAYSIPHVVGTCRMGPSPVSGDVVDALGRVHGVDRLSVIDASIIPEPPSGFPHIITIMLAEHLSQRLAALL